MPEIRYREIYTYPDGLPAKDRIPANAIITLEPYEVSDEQLAEEAELEEALRLLAKNTSLTPVGDIRTVLRTICKYRRFI